jgi:dihydropteroate synthase
LILWKAGKFNFNLTTKTCVMGILNVTPDSFSDGGLWSTPEKSLERAMQIQNEGADILDIGAQSTRPFYNLISPKEELSRLVPVLEILKGKIKIPISIDTFYPEVAIESLRLGANIINDVTGFANHKMLEIIAENDCGYVLMHGVNKFENGVYSPKTGILTNVKQTKNISKNINIETEIFDFFIKKLKILNLYGIKSERVCLDPGIGFHKTYEENLEVIKNIKKLKIKEIPILIGASRKKVVGALCEKEKSVFGTIALNTVAICNGANIIRCHDVAENVCAARVTNKLIYNLKTCI